jgi:hypothetical protein
MPLGSTTTAVGASTTSKTTPRIRRKSGFGMPAFHPGQPPESRALSRIHRHGDSTGQQGDISILHPRLFVKPSSQYSPPNSLPAMSLQQEPFASKRHSPPAFPSCLRALVVNLPRPWSHHSSPTTPSAAGRIIERLHSSPPFQCPNPHHPKTTPWPPRRSGRFPIRRAST